MNNEMTNDARVFINHINNNYKQLYCKFRQFCREKKYQFDEDIFQDTILKCYEAITKKGKLNDTTAYGLESYFFISFKINLKRESQYARNMKRDKNFTAEEIYQVYEDYVNNTKDSVRIKIINDLYKDFATLFLLLTVEENFSKEDFYLFRLKTLGGLTYKQIQEKVNVKGARQKIINIKNWLKVNVEKETIKKAFYSMYGELID